MPFYTDDLVIAQCVLACHVKAGTGKNELKDRPSHGIALYLGDGCAVTFSDKTRLQLQGPGLICFPQGSSYTITEQTPADWYAINFQLAAGGLAPFGIPVAAERFSGSFQTAVLAWNSGKDGYQWQVRALLYEILYRLRRQLSQSAKADRITPALQYIHENYLRETIRVSHLARLCGISQTYLRRQFTRQLGMSPNRYITGLKLEKAAQLLQSGMYTTAEVCYLSGFHDESYFSRSFKKHYGTTPGRASR